MFKFNKSKLVNGPLYEGANFWTAVSCKFYSCTESITILFFL